MSAKKSVPSKKSKPTVTKKSTRLQRMREILLYPFRRGIARVRALLSRRPHRSFRRTRRRDYVRSLKLPGYWAFTNHVRKVLWKNKKIFIGLIVVYGTLTAALIGMASQDTYMQLRDNLQTTGGELIEGNWGALLQAGLMLGTGITGSLNAQPTDLQRFYALALMMLVWLTTVWLLRAILADKRPRLRDGLYNASAPFLSTFLVSLLLIVQLLPAAIAGIIVGAAYTSGVVDGGIESMLLWVVVAILGMLSLYWMTSTFIALVVVTLPGMYPMQAIRTAGDLVIGRRLRILLRILWMIAVVAVIWVGIMVPVILLDMWLKNVLPVIIWLPIVPAALLAMGSFTAVWTSGYIYLLYRRVVDDDAAPA